MIKITKIVNEKIRETDNFARWGGEEFIILTPDISLDSANKLAEITRRNIEE